MRNENYKNIPKKDKLPPGRQIFGKIFTFQHNNSKHTSKLCKDYLNKLASKGILKIMNWPPQSQDLNPIELLWDEYWTDKFENLVLPLLKIHLMFYNRNDKNFPLRLY